jgi:glutamyl-tRNA reductase
MKELKYLERALIYRIDALDRILSQRMDLADKAMEEARRQVEHIMEGFPSKYAEKLELKRAESLMQDMKERDLKEVHAALSAKLPISEYDVKHEALLSQAEGWKTVAANIDGRIWASVKILGAIVIIVNVLLRLYW